MITPSLRRQKPKNRSSNGAHLLPHPRLHASQRAALVAPFSATLGRATDARLPAERGHTDGRVMTERVHERRLPDAETHDSRRRQTYALLVVG